MHHIGLEAYSQAKDSPGALGVYALDLAADPLFLKTGRPFSVCARAVHFSEKGDQYSAARCGLFPPGDFFIFWYQA